MKFPLLTIFSWSVTSVAYMRENGMMVLIKTFQLKKMMFWWSFCILLIHQYIFIGLQLRLNPGCQYITDYNCSQFQLLTFQGALIPSLEIQSFIHLPIENCSSTSNSFIIIGNFWKHLTLIHIKASFFWPLYSYSWLFQWIDI